FSRPELAKLLSSNPLLLKSSLKKQIIPSFNLLRNLFQSNDKTIKAIKRFDGILVYHAYVFSNMKVLRGIGVPESNILMMFSNPPALLCNPVRLKEIVEEAKRMGFDSLTKKFVHVVIALSSMSKSTLEKKFDVYRRWGWSDQEIREAFQRYPSCITASEDKIMAIMDFLVNKMGYRSNLVAKQASILSQSFEKRIVPRALFARELSSLGLVGNLTLSVLFDTLEKVFVNRFVNITPELLMLYEERRSFTVAGTELQFTHFPPERIQISSLGQVKRTSFVHGRQTIAASQSSNLLIFKQSSGLRFFSNSSNGHSFAATYLINKCGFSPEMASRVSNYVHFETPEKPDSLITFLENHGFSNTQILILIKRQPMLLLFDSKKTLSPKLEFLYSIGFSRPELAKLLSNYPRLLISSLEKQIIPSFNLLRSLFQSHDKTIKAIKRYTGILVYDSKSYLYPNMNVLRGVGVPESNILMLLNYKARTLLCKPVRLKEIVEEVKGMGIDSSTTKFLAAVIALTSMSKSTLEKKFDVYRRWGWSDQEIREAFQRYPSCVTASEGKIMAIMDFLVNKMGYHSNLVAKQPSIFSQSLEKRIVPRALFARELLSLGLVSNLTLSALFDTSEKVFVNRFVNIAPELLILYEEKKKKSV
ncbi:hypothetical protein Goshw_023592, partial [Gossypium schwendimanii]|nr:hypothetical protein [Gossypium schwendimanii]